MAVVTMKQLLDSGVHFGHQTRRWNPKMKRFIFTERNGIYIIDCSSRCPTSTAPTSSSRRPSPTAARCSSSARRSRRRSRSPSRRRGSACPYVNQRWLGGMLTNFQTVHKRLQRLKELEQIDFTDVPGSGMTKKELLVLQREKEKLERTLGGIRDMARVPERRVDRRHQEGAHRRRRGRKLGIPVVAILDTNCDPDEVDFKIPGNDDAIRLGRLLTRVIADAVADGLMARAGAQRGEDKSGDLATDEPLAEWEKELLQGQAADGTPRSSPRAAERARWREPTAQREPALTGGALRPCG
jgi:small subunit ribosomal protein S2